MLKMNPFWVLQAGRVIEAAERELGELSRGQKIDFLLDNIPDLVDRAEAVQLLVAIGPRRLET